MAFLWALLAHLLYDFHLQGLFMVQMKAKNYFFLFVHALTWALCVSVALVVSGIFAPWKLAVLLITHFLIDWWKARLMPDEPWALYVDQVLHVLTLILVVRW